MRYSSECRVDELKIVDIEFSVTTKEHEDLSECDSVDTKRSVICEEVECETHHFCLTSSGVW